MESWLVPLIVVCMFIQESCILSFPGSLKARAIASLTVLSGQERGQEFHFPHFFLKFWTSFLIFPQTLLIFVLILVLRVGESPTRESPTREGPGYATVEGLCLKDFLKVYCRSHQRDMVSHIHTHPAPATIVGISSQPLENLHSWSAWFDIGPTGSILSRSQLWRLTTGKNEKEYSSHAPAINFIG